mmetsp:Transcript_25691/g.59020  ORF Transcript_25691/g.59020 Transcript_25691/m.59020 type:complete len:247 (+) Transcript_25691:1153-1893(+)
MIEMTTAVLTHRKRAILKYKERCFVDSVWCDSKFVSSFPKTGNKTFAIAIPNDEKRTFQSFTIRMIRATTPMAITVAKVVKNCCLARIFGFTFKSCQRMVFGSSGSLAFRATLSRNNKPRCFAIEELLNIVKTWRCAASVSKVTKTLVTGLLRCDNPWMREFRTTRRLTNSGRPGERSAIILAKNRRCSSCWAAIDAKVKVSSDVPGSTRISSNLSFSRRSTKALTSRSLSTPTVHVVTWAPSNFS